MTCGRISHDKNIYTKKIENEFWKRNNFLIYLIVKLFNSNFLEHFLFKNSKEKNISIIIYQILIFLF